jgi:hypothetical protein
MRSCPTGKLVYSTRTKAIRALDRVRTERLRVVVVPELVESSAYRCPNCGWWHLSHLSRSSRRIAA